MTRFLSLLPKLKCTRQNGTIPLLIIVMAIITFFFDPWLNEHFVYQRQLISQGQWWRLLSGHLLHTNGYHLLLNIAALSLLWLLHCRFYTNKVYGLLFVFSGIFCSLGLYFFEVNLIQYVGLSGVLHGIFVWGALMDVRHGDKTGYLLLIGVLVKIIHEQLYGASTELTSLINASVAINAHLWGAIAGLVFFIIYPFFTATVLESNDSAEHHAKNK